LSEAGFSPLFIFSLVGVLSIYCGIATIHCCAHRRVRTDEEYGITLLDLEVVDGRAVIPRCDCTDKSIDRRRTFVV